MYAEDEYFFVVRTIEDADAAALGQTARGAPEEIMFQLFSAGLLEAEDFASLRIDPGHDMPCLLYTSHAEVGDRRERCAGMRVLEPCVGSIGFPILTEQSVELLAELWRA